MMWCDVDEQERAMAICAWTPNLDYGNAIENYPVVDFFAEFLLDPDEYWEVEWRDGDGCSRIEGTKVKHIETGRVWILTGEYHFERDSYHGRWPD